MIQSGIVVRHELAIRNLSVTATRKLTPGYVRITLSGADLVGFTSSGPTDHSKLFFPDPATGAISAPRLVDGSMQRPVDGTITVRDFTPRAFRDGTAPEVDFDFFLHGDGPASAWAATAAVGDPLVVAGPRGSRMPPSGISRVILAADETALPALARWIESVPDDVEIVAFATVANESDAAYLEPAHVNRARLVWIDNRPDALENAFRAYGPISDDTFVWAAGEATSLIPIRRYLRRELGLPAAQVKVDGYWKQGEAGRDHHAPVDPTDPED
ncbi:MAG TPA: siderophore-interacting protein [Homoserinimonas sp.]|nr:siderophore-interacting protein [Homoserinimonas sp.]